MAVVTDHPAHAPADRTRHDDPAALRAVAERVAVEAAEHLRALPRPWLDSTAPGGPVGVATKSSPTDVVTAADTALETLIRARLRELRPGDAVLGEEHGGAADGTGTTWVVDPIDGTVNFYYGIPWYTVSVAATRAGATVAGALAEPETGRLWSAARGAGATCDGRPLRASSATDLAQSLLGTGFGYRAERRARQARLVGSLLPRVRDIRRAGASTLDICAVAAGWLDAYLEHGLNWWDWGAASLVAEEAGAVVRVPGAPGSPPPDDGLGADATLVAAPGVAAELLALARELGAGDV